MHLVHRLYSFLLRFVLDEQVTWICANLFLRCLYEPVMDYFTKKRKSLNQVLVKLLPLFCRQVSSHIWRNCISDSDQSWNLWPLIQVDVHIETGFFVLKHVYSCKRCCLSLGCILGLSNDVVAITAVSQSNNSVDRTFKKLDFLKFTHSASLFDWR